MIALPLGRRLLRAGVVCITAWWVCGPLQASRRPSVGGQVMVAFAEPLNTPDPAVAVSFGDWFLVRQVHAGLYRRRGDQIQPDLATGRPRRVAPGRFRVELRASAVFHNGRRVRVSDVERMWSRAGVSSVTLRPRGRGVLEFSGTNSLTADQLVSWLSRLPRVVPAEDPRIGAGAFVFGVRGSDIRLSAHRAHHLGRPWLDRVVVGHSLGRTAVQDRFEYGRADVVFEDAERYQGAVRLAGPARETLGLFAWSRTTAEERRRVSFRAPRRRLAQRVPGRTSEAVSLLPFTDGPAHALPRGATPGTVRWYVGTTRELQPLVNELSAALSTPTAPWPVQPVGWNELWDVLDGRRSTTWTAVLTWWYHASDEPAAAREALGRFAGKPDWIPLVDRARVAVFRSHVAAVRWDDDGMIDFGHVWRR